MKRRIRLSESDLHRIVSNSVKRIMNEQYENFNSDEVYDYMAELVGRLGEEYVMDNLVRRIDKCTLYHWLKDIDEMHRDDEDEEFAY